MTILNPNPYFIGILFKFNGEFSNSKNVQQFYHIVVKLNASLEVVFRLGEILKFSVNT